jgi:hypothetical protein
MCAAKGHVCFTPKSGHVRCTSLCLLWANSGHARSLTWDINLFVVTHEFLPFRHSQSAGCQPP